MATNFSRSLDINIPPIQGGASGGYGAAAGMTDLAAPFNALGEKIRYERFGAQNIINRADEENAVTAATSSVLSNGIDALGSVISNRKLADARIEGQKKIEDARNRQATVGTIGSVVGAGLSLFTGGIA